MEFSRPEYWSGLPFPSPGDLPNPGIEPRSPALQNDCLPSEPYILGYIIILITSLYYICENFEIIFVSMFMRESVCSFLSLVWFWYQRNDSF